MDTITSSLNFFALALLSFCWGAKAVIPDSSSTIYTMIATNDGSRIKVPADQISEDKQGAIYKPVDGITIFLVQVDGEYKLPDGVYCNQPTLLGLDRNPEEIKRRRIALGC